MFGSILLVLVGLASAQDPYAGYVMSTNVPLAGWQYIDTGHFRIIFPDEAEAQGQYVATTLEALREPVADGFAVRMRPLPVILDNAGVASNGYVGLMPFRSSFFMTPMQSTFPGFGIGTTDAWLDALMVHEYRHAVQFRFARRGFVALSHYLGGELGWALGMGLSIPAWYSEGDAVLTETLLTQGGRGRSPAFDMGLRAMALEGRPFSYEKAWLGSLKDPIPDHYVLGYHMVSYGRSRYGLDIWNDTVRRTANWAFIPFRFSHRVGHATGHRLPGFYREMMADLRSRWTERLEGLAFTEARQLHEGPGERDWTQYLSPRRLDDGSVIAFVSGTGTSDRLVRIWPDGREQTLVRTGARLQEQVGVGGHEAVWSEVDWDLRWVLANRAVIRILDLETGETRDLCRGSRLFSPDLSPDGSRLGAVFVGPSGEVAYVLLDPATGQELRRFDAPAWEFWSTPRFSDDGRAVAFVRTHPKAGRGIGLLDLDTGGLSLVLPFAHENVSDPVLRGGRIFYTSTRSGIDNIWSLDPATGQTFQVSSRKYGAFGPEPSSDGKSLLFADYTWSGTRIAEMPLDSATWIPEGLVEDRSLDLFAPLYAQEPQVDVLAGIPEREWTPRPYRRGTHLFSPHSWSILPDVGNNLYTLGITSTDPMGTLEAGAVYEFDSYELTHYAGLTASFQGLTPIFDVSAGMGGRTVTTLDSESLTYDTAHWKERSAGIGARVPLNLSSHAWNQSLEAGVFGSYVDLYDLEGMTGLATATQGQEGSMARVDAWVAANRSLRVSDKDIGPRWGQGIRLHSSYTPSLGSLQGGQLSAVANLYVPGVGRHDHISLVGAGQHNLPGDYTFSSQIPFARGYRPIVHETLAYGSLGWRTPVWYPDLAIGPLAYIRRLSVGAFVDQGLGLDGSDLDLYPSFGSEIALLTNIMRLKAPFDLGVRVSWLLADQEPAVEPYLGGTF